MATSAVGPGFSYTDFFVYGAITYKFRLLSILISILLDIGAQLNIWRIITVSENRAQDVANELLPGLGYFLAGLIAFGGLVFNVGNFAGTGLGVNILTGIQPAYGAIVSLVIALGIFWV